MKPALHRFRGPAIETAYFEWLPERARARPTLLFVHATGFHARVWDSVIAHLGERHVFSVDQRGHGRSEKAPIEHWRSMGEDLAALIRHLGLEDAIGVGHSMGGHALTEAAAACPGAFQSLLLVDPVIASPGDYGDYGEDGEDGWMVSLENREPHPTAKRKNEFASPDEMFERFRDRLPYSLFEPQALRDYCEYGLLPAAGGYVLACSPETEASIYMTSRTNPGVYAAIRRLEIPVTVLRARRAEQRDGVMDFTASPTWPGLADEFQHGRDVYLPDQTHFLPMAASKLVADFVLGARG